jgi:uroporphyrinogen-III synthase
MKTVFISKNSDDLSLLPSFCTNNNIRLIAQPLIYFRERPFKQVKPFDVLFVNSIRAFEFFTKSAPISETCEIACVGNTTAKRLRQLGYTPSFVGTQAGNPELVAEELNNWIGDRHVLIPCSSLSARSISKKLNPAKVFELVVYETVLLPTAIEQADAYIFTSPSNAQAFFLKNDTGDSRVIAWGRTTEQALSVLGVMNAVTMNLADEQEAVSLLEKWL